MKGEYHMAQTVFNRIEKKYLLTEFQYESILKELQPYMETDNYGLHTIGNIYYDTPDNQLIRTSIEKPAYKEKLRLRSYGIPHLNDTVFLEIKKKAMGIVNKRRISIRLGDAYCYLKNGIIVDQKTQIHKELDAFLRRYHLQPKLYLAYDRIAMFGKEDPEFRVTFDCNIRSRTSNLRLEAGSYGELLFLNRERIMEVKVNGAMPLWFSQILSHLEIYSTSFSKYGTVYKKQMKDYAVSNENHIVA